MRSRVMPASVRMRAAGVFRSVRMARKMMLGGDVFILEPVGFLVGQVDNSLDTRGDEDLREVPSAVDVGPGRRRSTSSTFRPSAPLDTELLQDLRHDAVGLLQQREQDCSVSIWLWP